jgi:hypothetical protein
VVISSDKLSQPIKKVLFISHKKAQCGVYEFGKSITNVLEQSANVQFIRVECSSITDLHQAINQHAPSAIIYNYYPSVMPWIVTEIGKKVWKNNIAAINIPQIGIIHEITQLVADTANNYKKRVFFRRVSALSNSLFDYYISPDPTLLLRNPIVYKTGRLIPAYENMFPIPLKPTIGCFGFATPQKGFENIIRLVQQEYDDAVIRFNIPSADFADDRNGAKARALAEKCKSLLVKKNIQLIVTHDYWDSKSMLDFLAQNTVNVFLYEHDNNSRKGLSSTVDNAMAVQRPIAISDAIMFRHLFDCEPSIRVSRNSLKNIVQNGFTPLQKHYHEWTAENLIWEYERIIKSVVSKWHYRHLPQQNIVQQLKSKYKRMFSIPENASIWLRSSDNINEDDMTPDTSIQYRPIQLGSNDPLNRILDDSARALYAPAIKKITELVPITVSKKIARANVQQAFVFDTVYRSLRQYKNPKVLCVGSYEDTAAMSLRKMGMMIEEIDPTQNYYLQEYYTKPSTIHSSYDIIFSTSVIEHDPDDESFIRCVDGLLAPGGMLVLTCDYKDGWKSTEPKPVCNERFYTQIDLKERLLPLLTDCQLAGEPHWECSNPDFNYLEKYQYTFATFVVQKKK